MDNDMTLFGNMLFDIIFRCFLYYFLIFFGYNFFQRICKQMGKMTISGKDCFTKAIPNDDTDIWTISGCQDAPYPPRIHHQRLRIGTVLTGKMTISGKDCFSKAIPNDDTDIWTPPPDVRMPPILQRSTTRDGG